MSAKVYKFGLCSSKIKAHLVDGTILNYESSTLIEEASKVFEEVVLIHPWWVTYRFLRDRDKPIIKLEGKDISDLSCLVVRGTNRQENAISVLVHALKICGCAILDPIERFTGESASKLLTTIDRYEKRVGTDSYYVFSLKEALELLHDLYDGKVFPLLYKPIGGRQGLGIRVFKTLSAASDFAREFFSDENEIDTPLFLQSFIEFEAEYRVMIIGDKCIGVAKKQPKEGVIPANVARGGTLKKVNAPEVVEFSMDNVNLGGIIGIDVARDLTGQLHIIEANRAPLWKEFERVTGVNVAREIINYAFQRSRA